VFNAEAGMALAIVASNGFTASSNLPARHSSRKWVAFSPIPAAPARTNPAAMIHFVIGVILLRTLTVAAGVRWSDRLIRPKTSVMGRLTYGCQWLKRRESRQEPIR